MLFPSYSGTSVGMLNTPVVDWIDQPLSVIRNDEFGVLVGRSQYAPRFEKSVVGVSVRSPVTVIGV